MDSIVGRVLQVHGPLRFVVLDFSLNASPPPGSRWEVYRGASKVGLLKVGHFRRESIVAADIVSGDVAEGDVARPEIAD